MADSSNVNPSSKKPYGTGRFLIGTIYFADKSSSLTKNDRKELDKLVDLLATWPKGMSAAKLLFLGQRDSKEPKALAQRRADEVKKYVETQLKKKGKESMAKIKAQAAGTAKPPGRPPGRSAKPRRAVVLINEGKRLWPARPKPERAKSKKQLRELIVSVECSWRHMWKGRDVRKERTRIQYWTMGKALFDIWHSNGKDGYVNANAEKVKEQSKPASKKLNESEFSKLINEHRIVEKLMEIGGKGTDHATVIQRLVDIDREILFGICYLVDKVAGGAAGPGLQQMTDYVTDKGEDKRHFYYAYRHPDKIPPFHVIEKK